MKRLGLLISIFIFLQNSTKATESQGLLLRGYVPSMFKVAFKEQQTKKTEAVYTLITESNTLKITEDHKVEVDNPMGLEVDFKLLAMDSSESKKEYQFVIKNNQKSKILNPTLILKISAN